MQKWAQSLKIRRIIFLLGAIFLSTPSILNSADIYESSYGAVRVEAVLNPHVVAGDSELGDAILLISTPSSTPSVDLDVPCEHSDTVLSRTTGKEGRAIFLVRSTVHAPCTNTSVRVSIDGKVFTDTQTSLPIAETSDTIRDLTDYSSDALTQMMRTDYARSVELMQSTRSTTSVTERLARIRDRYEGIFLTKRTDLMRMILDARAREGYISPVARYEVPRIDKLMPGTGRPYRKDTTDGIHHGWDILAPYGTSVRALGKGVIVRIVSGWKWADFDELKRRNVSVDDELTNLDIFRGNQVWLKTMDGNVTFYSHLSQIDPNVHVGSVVEAGTRLGAIGTTGVPDRNYKDIHLHFEIQKNPHMENPATPSILDIMRWAYVGMGEPRPQIHADTRALFPKNITLTSGR